MTMTYALHDGRAGNARQALALARALDVDAGEWPLVPGQLARWFAPRKWPLLSAPFGPGFRADCEDPPELAIGCGRQAALATRLLRAAGSKVVQILDPRIDPRHWDVVVAPEHDGLRGDNVVTMLGSLHPVDDLWLAQARREFQPLEKLPSPHTALLVGGPSRHAALDDVGFQSLLQMLSELTQADGGSFSVIASRRTPASWREAMGRVPQDLPGIRWRDEHDGTNAYAGLLGHADRIVCTPDSVNMLSEAAATLVPVFAWKPQAVMGRPRRFLDTLLERGRIRALGQDTAMDTFDVEPLRETVRIAAAIRRHLNLPS
ncbi:mitochondrial fission ELM1 family protein [Thermomonas sp.]|uniref:mitochondrial fission ELM1 family protein n=1 Tax=Thermomonas sp. TaxID=1971895 RepID=UPI0024888B67|nr:mitochondrial fission ELM1 family protein [Thermomonas sp.]MDI1252577.1 mitochondrial fission ELM1 family protein [Thermomonas sp.]